MEEERDREYWHEVLDKALDADPNLLNDMANGLRVLDIPQKMPKNVYVVRNARSVITFADTELDARIRIADLDQIAIQNNDNFIVNHSIEDYIATEVGPYQQETKEKAFAEVLKETEIVVKED